VAHFRVQPPKPCFPKRSAAFVVQESSVCAADEIFRAKFTAMDALNLAAAMRLGAQEFVTTETSNKPMFRVPGLKVVSLFAAGSK